jgi:alpha-L-fucosidase
MKFEPTFESLKQHEVPAWYHDAKLGIFVHWGLFSVPAWAPRGDDIDKQVANAGWESMFANNPYAEWYLNTLRVGSNPTYRYHTSAYGANFTYDDFIPQFNEAAQQWNPAEWADLFHHVGARYVVLTSKHHDGFLLWPGARTSPHKPSGYAAQRDIVGELTEAVRQKNMRMGLYYSGGLDWTFNETPVYGYMDVYETIVQSPDFVDYANGHWRELIDRYAPSLFWNDIGYPAAANLPELFAHYYNMVADGVINDRWRQQLPERVPGAGEMINPPPSEHCDFTTPEYAAYSQINLKKWEATRGIGHSFGYNQNETVDDYLSVEKLVHTFVDIVSKNGNLLLNVGPTANGTIPDLQRERLLGLGAWLDVNGEAIYASRPWSVATGQTQDGGAVRYTQKAESLYAMLLDAAPARELIIHDLRAAAETTIRLLGDPAPLSWQQRDNTLTITLPESLAASPAHALKITPQPRYTGAN